MLPHWLALWQHPRTRFLYTAQQVRDLEKAAFIYDALTETDLMQRAGAAAYDFLCEHYPLAQKVLIVCGKGNNAGDGFVLAQLMQHAGLRVTVALSHATTVFTGAAANAYAQLRPQSIQPQAFTPEMCLHADVIVDGLLGTGLRAVPDELFSACIDSINTSGKPVLSLDIPSGLLADSGAVPGVAVCADRTISFIGLKAGLCTGRGPALCGDIALADLGLSQRCYDDNVSFALLNRFSDLQHLLPKRNRDAHKGLFGHTLIVGGANGMGGAGRLAAEAAARTGSGRVSAYVSASSASALLLTRPEVMSHAYTLAPDANDLAPLLAQASVVVLGPGLSRAPWLNEVLDRIAASETRQVWDADALFGLAQAPRLLGHAILTPHPLEAARLLNCSVEDIESNRFDAARKIALRYHTVVVLKGAGTVISDGKNISVLTEGNPGMASAGMGDVLAGIIGALWAQGVSAFDAAQMGAALHACAGDRAARDGQVGLLAGDLIAQIRTVLNGL